MDHFLISLLLTSLCVVSSWKGEMVTITCCWTQFTVRARVFWLKSETRNKEYPYIKDEARVFQTMEEYCCSSLTFPSISREDAGTYICRVTIGVPHLSVAHGNGTVITVTFKEKTSDNTTRDKVRGASSNKLVVKQTPDVSAKEGEMVTITCCWTENIERVRVNWMKSQTGNKEDLNMKNQLFQKMDRHKCSSLTFPNISREDAGTYICKVTMEIPVLTIAHGNGTVITVTSKNETFDNTTEDKVRDAPLKPELIYVLRCLPIVTLILTFFCFYHFGTRAQKQTSAAPGNEPTLTQRKEEDQEEEERDDRVIEAAGE